MGVLREIFRSAIFLMLEPLLASTNCGRFTAMKVIAGRFEREKTVGLIVSKWNGRKVNLTAQTVIP
jgi:hypothetical protein